MSLSVSRPGLAFNPEQLFIVAQKGKRATRQGNRLNAWNAAEFVVELTKD